MSRRISFVSPYLTVLRQTCLRGWRGLMGPIFRMSLGRSRVKAFNNEMLKLKLGLPAIQTKYIGGQFDYAGQYLNVGLQGDPWTIAVPSTRFASWLHGFSWLEDLVGSKGQAGHVRARGLVDSWIMTYGQWNDFAWSPDILSERLFYWLAYWAPSLSVDNASPLSDKRRSAVLRQLKALRKLYGRVSHGIPKLRAAAAYALAGARLPDGGQVYLARGLDWLDDEIEAQILPDGGHISRSPGQTAEALKILLMLDQILSQRGVEGSRILSRAIDRLAPAVAFFQHSDGGLAVFHGGGERDTHFIKKLLAAAPGNASPFSYCPHTGYQRLQQAETILLLDTGSAPARPYDLDTHMAPLAMEISTKAGRLISSCGWSDEQPVAWRRPVRSAAAHNTLILNEQSPGRLLADGWKSRSLGEVVEREAGPVKAVRKEQAAGIWLQAHHDGYRDEFGLQHNRRLYMSKEGDDIRGEDSLSIPLGAPPVRRDEIPFHIRFHVHPDVRVSLSQDQSSAILIQGGKAGWRLRTDAGPLTIEDSVYLARGHKPVKTKQIVISGMAYADSDGESRTNRVRWSLRELKSRQK